MTTMVERVARAIRDHACEGLPELPSAWWMEQARAAIAAMREPTEAMCRAAENAAWDHTNSMPMPSYVSRAFTGAIDAALNEEPEA